MRKVIAVAAIAVFALAGCSKRSVDVDTSGAQKVNGTSVLYRFCDMSTLIYVSIVPQEDDNYEAFFYGGCVWDAKTKTFIPAIGPDVEPRTSPKGAETDETNQQDERDEK